MINNHFTSIKNYDRQWIEKIIDECSFYSKQNKIKDFFDENKYILSGKIITTLFLSESFRTKASFTSAFLRLGGSYLEFSEQEKYLINTFDETYIRESISFISQYADCLVTRLRSEQELNTIINSSSIPVISAGHGTIEHPTTALNYLQSIYLRYSRLENLKVLIIDREFGRCSKSLLLSLSKFSQNLFFYLDEGQDKNNVTLFELIENIPLKKIFFSNIESLHDYDIIFLDEDKSDYKDIFIPPHQFTLFSYQTLSKRTLFIHAKPVYRLYDDELKTFLQDDLSRESLHSSLLKGVLFKEFFSL